MQVRSLMNFEILKTLHYNFLFTYKIFFIIVNTFHHFSLIHLATNVTIILQY